MDILTLLKEDHTQVAKILDKLSDTSLRASKTRETLFSQLEEAFTRHAEFEEKIFYPAVKNEPATKDLILEAYEEHHEVKLILEELRRLSTENERWRPKLIVIKENIRHHVREEENDLFPKVKTILPQERLIDLANIYKDFMKG